MHDEPDFERVLDRVRQNGNELRRAPRDILLAAADADARAQRRELGEVVVATKDEIFASQSLGEFTGAAESGVVAVEADQTVVFQVGERTRLAETREVVAVGEKPDARGADAGDHGFQPYRIRRPGDFARP